MGADEAQLDLLSTRVRKPSAPVDVAYLYSLPNLRRAVRYSASLRDLEPKDICDALKMDAATWSRITNGTQEFPTSRLKEWRVIADNNAALMWLAHDNGFALTPLRSALEDENTALKAELAEERRKTQVITDFIRETQKR